MTWGKWTAVPNTSLRHAVLFGSTLFVEHDRTAERPYMIYNTHREWNGLRNLTPHALRVCGPWAPSDGADFILEPWGAAFRLPETSEDVFPLDLRGISARRVAYDLGAVALPPEENGVRWIISLPALLGLRAAGCKRSDLCAPDTSKGAIRNERGEIAGTTGIIFLE